MILPRFKSSAVCYDFMHRPLSCCQEWNGVYKVGGSVVQALEVDGSCEGNDFRTALAMRKCYLATGGSHSCRPYPACLIPYNPIWPRIDAAVTLARTALAAQHQLAER